MKKKFDDGLSLREDEVTYLTEVTDTVHCWFRDDYDDIYLKINWGEYSDQIELYLDHKEAKNLANALLKAVKIAEEKEERLKRMEEERG